MSIPDELQQVMQQLFPQFEEVSVRGQGQGAFVFAQHKGRAVEVSTTDEGRWWLEFWEVNPDPDAGPVEEMTVQTPSAAIREAELWLACRRGQPVPAARNPEMPQP